MILTLEEIIYFFILVISIAYIFTPNITSSKKENFKIALLAASPSVFFHELFHKITAIILGYSAEFHIYTTGMILGILLKLINSPFLIIAPGFVSIASITNALEFRLIALAGPLANLFLFLTSSLLIKFYKNLNTTQLAVLHLSKKINLLLLIFNMIPIPPLDGSKVLFGLS